jgi:ATP-dependent Lhr-like helicase
MMSKAARSTATRKEGAASPLDGFLPVVAGWFRKTFAAPSPAQVLSWPAIRRGENTLLLAPTGSGKTLAAFLCAIDDLYRRAQAGDLVDGIQVLYVSPLKALGNDIHRNLMAPLEGIRRMSRAHLPELRVAVRTGDTPQSERAKMLRRPPHILITTPESLYILLASPRMAPALRSIRTVIVDEVHAICANKRGVHLAVSLERLAACTDSPPQRIGCSATLNPLDQIAAFLVGCEDGRPRPCTIVDAGMRKHLDVQVRAPLSDFLEASNTALWSSAYELLLEDIGRHRTTLIFTNSRYKAERTALRLGELAGGRARIGAHHGSMSRETRLVTEDALKAGRLDALVATSSLELGIDVGSVDAVYQMESPRSVAAGLQRVGRAGHLLGATSKGRMLIFERDELVEAAAIARAMLAGEIDAVCIPQDCLDVLAQQIVGAVAAGAQQADDLFALVRQACPYRDLPRESFDAVLSMLAGEHRFQMAHAPMGLVLWDRSAGRLSPTRSSAHVACMCAGTIPEATDYEVVIASSNKRVGTVHNEFVDDSLRNGDVFVLGSTAWRMIGTRKNRVLVEEAPGATPTVPWWVGDVESRTCQVGVKVAQLRREVAGRLADPKLPLWLQNEYHVCPHAAAAIIDYVREQQAAAGIVPDEKVLLVETWRDELGRMNVILHSPYGMRLNRTWGTAIAAIARKRFRQEWSVTATNDVLLLTQREQATAPLHEADAQALFEAIRREHLADLIAAQAGQSASFGTSFRDAAVCAFQILRAWRGKRVAPWLQNHRAAELYEVARHHPRYPVVAEVLRQYLHESLDLPALADMLRRIDAGDVQLVFRDVQSPSPFAHSVLVQDLYSGDHQMGRERRAHLLRLHRQVLQEVLTSEQMAQLLDPRAIERLELRLLHRSETTRALSPDELAQCIRDLGDLPATLEALGRICEGDPLAPLRTLVRQRRIVAIRHAAWEQDPVRLIVPEHWQTYHDAFSAPGKRNGLAFLAPRIGQGQIEGFKPADPARIVPTKLRKKLPPQAARAAIVERYLRCRGPVTQYEIMNATGWPIGAVEQILDALVEQGGVARGVYTNLKPSPQWVNKANLEQIHRLTMEYLKRELAACAPYEVVDFMTRWQHLHPSTRLRGLDGLRQVIRQLQGFEVVQGALETEILPGRLTDYQPAMLDRLIASGEVCWRRVDAHHLRRGMLTLCFRKDASWLGCGAKTEYDGDRKADVDIRDQILKVRDFFRKGGPAYFDDILEATGLDEGTALRAVWHLAWCGEVCCDTYECLRHAGFEATLSACYDLMNRPDKILRGKDSHERVVARMRRRKLDPRLGLWWPTERLAPPKQPLPDSDVLRRWAQQLLARWGIVSRQILEAEVAAPPWSALLPQFKRLELLGKVSRGYFIEAHPGEQFGLPEAVDLLRDCRARRAEGRQLGYLPDEAVFAVTFHDPSNLYDWCLEMANEAGQVLERSRKLGLHGARMVLQAGQPLIAGLNQQMVRMTRAQLSACIDQLKHNAAGQVAPIQMRSWNGYPIDAHPAGRLLRQLGFACVKGVMCWPAPRADLEPPPPGPIPQEFLPYHLDRTNEMPDILHVLSRAGPVVRPIMEKILPVLEKESAGDGWQLHWGGRWPYARYRQRYGWSVHVTRTYVFVNIHPEAITGYGKHPHPARLPRLESAEDITEEFLDRLRQWRRCVEISVDCYLARKQTR